MVVSLNCTNRVTDSVSFVSLFGTKEYKKYRNRKKNVEIGKE